MPSLQELKQLQDLFGEIGHENEILNDEGIDPPVYDLPTNEPIPRAAPMEDETPPESEPPPETPPPDDQSGAESENAGADMETVVPPTPVANETDFDDDVPIFDNLFDQFKDLIPDELPPLPDTPAAAQSETDKPAQDNIDDAAASMPQPEENAVKGDASGDDASSDRSDDAPDNESNDASGDDDKFDLEDLLKGFGDDDMPPDAGDEDFSIPDNLFGDNDAPPDAGDNDFSIPDNLFGDNDAPPDAGDNDFSIPDNLFGDNDAPPAAAPSETGTPAESGGFDGAPSVSEISDEEKASLFPDIPPEDAPPDAGVTPPDAEDKAPATPKEEKADDKPVNPAEIDDFVAPIDAAEVPPIVPTVAEDKSKKTEDAINLTDQQLSRLLDTIASYPLNLRIACEQIISEEIVEPALLSQLIKLLVNGGNAREAAALAGKILKRKINLPKGFKTGEELEAEQASFRYIFFHKFFPVVRISLIIAALAASIAYLSYEFIYKPVHAYLIYKNGYEQIEGGEYALGNRRFEEAFKIHRDKNWFYRYAGLFRDEKQYLYAEEKYDALLLYYPRDKKGTLEYAAMEKDYLRNYEKADRLIRINILDYSPDDREGLLALGDINLAWGEYEFSRYEEARLSYAKLLAAYGQSDSIMERMMLYFIRTDKLGEVIPLQNYFMGRPKSKIPAESLAELGGYLLDKRFEVVKGVPDEYIEEIEGIRDVLLRAAKQDFSLPEAHYHLARYYNNYGATLEERQMLETAANAFDAARIESPKRTQYRVDTQRRLARMMIADHEFISAEEALAKGVNIMEDAVERRVVRRSPEFGELYAYLGDLAYFVKSGDMREAVDFYQSAEENGWSPPEMRYRLGSAYYRLGDYAPAMNYFFAVSMERPYNRRLLNALGTASYMRSDYFAAEGYFKRLVNTLENERSRFPMLFPHERPEHYEIVERMMVARNNLGVTYNALAAGTGRSSYRAEALGEFAEAARAWDALERNPQTMIRAGIVDTSIPGVSLPYLNIQNILYPTQDSSGLLFMQIDKDLDDNSWWESLMHSEGLP